MLTSYRLQNTIFYTHVVLEDSPTKTIYIRHYTHTYIYIHTQAHRHAPTHNDCSRNWVLILAGVEIL